MKEFKSKWTKNSSIIYLLLFFILLLAVFLRFYHTPQRYGFDPDPTRDALLISYAAEHWKFPLIGAMSGIAPFTFGPWYYYQLIIWQILFPLSYASWVFIGLSSVLVSFVCFKIGSLLESKWFGLLLAFIVAVSPSETGQTQGLSNPNLIPFYASLAVLLFIIIYKKSKLSGKWFFLWGMVLGIGINIHYQMIGLCILPVIYFFYKHEQLFLRLVLFSLGIFIVFIPLLLFNVLNHWHTLTGIMYYLNTGRHTTYIPNNWRLYLFNFWLPYWSYIFGVNNIFGMLTILFSFGTLAVLALKKKLSHIYLFLFLSFIFNFFVLRYFLAQRDYYYYLFLHPFIFIFFGFALYKIFRYTQGIIFAIGILCYLTILMLQQDAINLGTREDTKDMMTQAQKIQQLFPNTSYTLYACSKGSINFAEGVEFFLQMKNSINENGSQTRIGVRDWACDKKYEVFTSFSKIGNFIYVMNLNGASNAQLLHTGWTKITPASVYHDTVDWWE